MISPQKSTSSYNLSSDDEKVDPVAAKSCESLYSHNSSKSSVHMVYRSKRSTGQNRYNLPSSIRQSSTLSSNNEIRQRVLSARRLRMKTYQNQLADAQQTISNLENENRILRTLHKRQDSALAKYESTNAELPQLLHSHAEELRMWQSKYRSLQIINKDLEQKLKQKESLILSLSDQNKYFMQLSKDKNLEERQRLTERVQASEARLEEKENEINILTRKLQLENKRCKHQQLLEQQKTKDAMVKLEKARMELSSFRKLEEIQLQERFNLHMRQSSKKTTNIKENNINKLLQKKSPNHSETTEDTETQHSERSIQSSNHSLNSTIRSQHTTTRTIKKMVISNNPIATNNINSTGKISNTALITTTCKEELSKQLSVNMSKPIITMRRMDQGDGDASSTNEFYKMSRSPTKLSMKLTPPEPVKLPPEYEYDEDENIDNGLHSYEEYTKNNRDGHGDIGDFINNIDCEDGDIDNVDSQDESIDDNKGPDTEVKARMKQDISTLRKQISDDYKERESFLDNFCRQASQCNIPIRKEPIKKRNTNTSSSVSDQVHGAIPGNRKHKMLAALKTIDNGKGTN